MDRQYRILIVDDEPNIRSGLAKGLVTFADQIETAASANEAIDKFKANHFQLVIADVRMPGDRDGLDLISLVKQYNPDTAIIVITAHGSLETAIDAMRRGAFDFINKPIDLNLIRQRVAKAIERHRLQNENQQLKRKLVAAGEISGIVGNSQTVKDLFARIRQIATTNASVLIQGESGTGKELMARAIHDLSDRSNHPFVTVNLGALPRLLIETELFGHESEAPNEVIRHNPGCFEKAAGGTLFLDEITEIPLKNQVELMRVLETQRFTRIGSNTVQESDIRFVSATNRDVGELLQEGTFREDLYYRLNVVPLYIPPLRSRRSDIPLLVEHFLDRFCQRHGRPAKTFSAEAMQCMIAARWPGNVRQLRNVIERIVVIAAGDEIRVDDLPLELRTPTPATSHSLQTLAEATESAEKSAITAALIANDHHREQTARSLSISVRTLHYKMNKYDLH